MTFHRLLEFDTKSNKQIRLSENIFRSSALLTTVTKQNLTSLVTKCYVHFLLLTCGSHNTHSKLGKNSAMGKNSDGSFNKEGV